MADFAGVSRAVYMSYENGKRTPDAEVLFNIAARFGLNMSVFFENNYKELSSFSKGMLIERSECLKDWDKIRESKRKMLEENRLKK